MTRYVSYSPSERGVERTQVRALVRADGAPWWTRCIETNLERLVHEEKVVGELAKHPGTNPDALPVLTTGRFEVEYANGQRQRFELDEDSIERDLVGTVGELTEIEAGRFVLETDTGEEIVVNAPITVFAERNDGCHHASVFAVKGTKEEEIAHALNRTFVHDFIGEYGDCPDAISLEHEFECKVAAIRLMKAKDPVDRDREIIEHLVQRFVAGQGSSAVYRIEMATGGCTVIG